MKFARKFSQAVAHEDGIWCCAWSRFEKENTDIIVSGSVDDKIKIWSWSRDNLELRHTCEGHQLGVVSVDINKAGTNILFIKSIY
jgi:WD repeat-containing protein 61